MLYSFCNLNSRLRHLSIETVSMEQTKEISALLHLIDDPDDEVYSTVSEKIISFGKEIIPTAIGNYKVASYQYEGYWTDIGNIYSFFEANISLTDEVPQFNLFDSAQTVYTRSRMLPPAKISGTQIQNAIVAEGSIIHAASITKSVIGIRSRIGKDTVIKNSYIMGCDYYETIPQINQKTEKGQPVLGIGDRCVIEDAIVDKNCSIGNDVQIKGGPHLEKIDHPLYTVKDGIVVIKKGAVIPNGFVI